MLQRCYRYKVSNVTSQEVRRIAETEVNSTFKTSQKEGAARYMAHTTAVAKSHYRMLVPAAVVQTAVLLDKLSGCSPQRASQTDETSQQEERTFDGFKASFPVTNDGHPPAKKQRMDAGFSGNHTYKDKWRGLQYIKWGNYLLSHFQIRKLVAGSVSRSIAKEGWQTNHPSVEEDVKMWRPASRQNVEGDKHVLKSVASHKWKGVTIKEFGGERKGSALKDIKVDDELKFDYGVKRKSFKGEGLDLRWLDE
ncbi:hypothetical protein VZT92_021105 [Zoarces viviparus]|uniref:SET domain-containing protein n=1 Tax=Zoarces viviparus TaxID=48416 RepID=A0AAW1EF27_ZOAVI